MVSIQAFCLQLIMSDCEQWARSCGFVFTTTGGMAPEAKRFIRRLAVLIATKTNEEYSQVMCNIRTRLSMDIMRSVLVAVRGVRGKVKKAWTAPISNVSFNLIPEERSYEG